MVSSASAGTVGHAEGQGLQRDAHPTQGRGESHVLARGSPRWRHRSRRAHSPPISPEASLARGQLSTGRFAPASRPQAPNRPGNRKKGPGGCPGGCALSPPLQSPVESPPLSRPQAPPKLTLSFKQENFLPESYRPYLCKHSEKTPLAFLVKGVSLPAQWSI